MEKTDEKKKNAFIDYLKGIAILLVLVGHCVQYGSGASFLENDEYEVRGAAGTMDPLTPNRVALPGLAGLACRS